MNKEQLKLKWKYLVLSIFSGLVALKLFFVGINGIYMYYNGSFLIDNGTADGIGGFINLFAKNLSLLWMLIGIIGILIGFFMIKVSINVYKEKRWAIIFFLIFSIVLIFFNGRQFDIKHLDFYLVWALFFLISIVISIKILLIKKTEIPKIIVGEQLKSDWKYSLLSSFCCLLSIRLVFFGISSIYSYFSGAGFFLLALSPSTSLLSLALMGIIVIFLFGLFLIKVSFDIYKERKWSIILFLIVSFLLMLFDITQTDINHFNFYPVWAILSLVSIIISIKILLIKKTKI